jgi:hypothetical protein
MPDPEIRPIVVREPTPIFDRMFSAMEKVRERLDRACNALEAASIPYAVIGGNAVAAWVATIDDGAVRNTRDVDLLLDRKDLDRATEALSSVGFVRDQVMDVIVFLDGPEGKPSQGIHILAAGQKVKQSYVSATPTVEQASIVEGKRIVDLTELVRMKLNSYRRKDQTHLLDMIGVGLIDNTWPAKFEPSLGDRLQTLIDDPDG